MLRYFAQTTFGRLGMALAAPFMLLAALFGALALYRSTQPADPSATELGAYALLFAVLGAVMFAVSWALARYLERIAADDR